MPGGPNDVSPWSLDVQILAVGFENAFLINGLQD
jgi:hypothetical protein